MVTPPVAYKTDDHQATNKRKTGQTDTTTERQTDRRRNKQTNTKKDGQKKDRKKEGRTKAGTDKRKDRQTTPLGVELEKLKDQLLQRKYN